MPDVIEVVVTSENQIEFLDDAEDVIEVLTVDETVVEVVVAGPQGDPGVGVPAGGTTGQALVKNSNTDFDTEWATPASSGRELLTANRTYYVRQDGSNSNDGLANTAGGAWLTIQHAWDFISENLDCAGFYVTIQLADSATPYVGLFVESGSAGPPNGAVYIKGNLTTPANVKISQASVGGINTCIGIFTPSNVVTVYINGVTLVGAAGNGRAITLYGSNVFVTIGYGPTFVDYTYPNPEFILDGFFLVCFEIQFGARLETEPGPMTFVNSGTSINTVFLVDHSICRAYATDVVASGGTVGYGRFVWCRNSGSFYGYFEAITGTFTGKYYEVTQNAVAGETALFPGNAAGTTATGGQVY